MKRFAAIEGLRGWLAWAVFMSHLPYMTGGQLAGLDPFVRSVGATAVKVFIIVSGFVITHLILEQRLPYRQYIVQRFMRLFPLFVVTAFVGFFTSDLLSAALSGDPTFHELERFDVTARAIAGSTHQYFWWHVLAHGTMLHGLVPNWLLPHSDYAFNIPAWSISLEWQFYLVAPFIIFLLREKRTQILTLAVGMAVLEILFRRYHGTEPRALPLGASLFAVGIASRFVYPEIENRKWLAPALALAIVALALDSAPRAIVLWMVVLLGMSKQQAAARSLNAVFNALLTSPLAKYFGSRSYSVYLCHYLVLSATIWTAFHFTGHVPGILLTAAIGVPATLLVSELTYRYIEIPGIQFGRKISAHLSGAPDRKPQLAAPEVMVPRREKQAA